MVKSKTRWTPDQALRELKRWCAAQDRCHAEVRTKLIEHGVYGDDLENIIVELISEDFLNEGRFAAAYVSGKFRINEWGRNKIMAGLKARQVSSYNIKKSLATIDEDEYRLTLKKLMDKKHALLTGTTSEKKLKMTNYLLQRGFESSLIAEAMGKNS